jgi:glycogen phosphorylase
MATTRPVGKAATPTASVRTGLSAQSLRLAVLDNLAYMQGRYADIAAPHDWYMALAYSVRDRLLARWVDTVRTYLRTDVKVACPPSS